MHSTLFLLIYTTTKSHRVLAIIITCGKWIVSRILTTLYRLNLCQYLTDKMSYTVLRLHPKPFNFCFWFHLHLREHVAHNNRILFTSVLFFLFVCFFFFWLWIHFLFNCHFWRRYKISLYLDVEKMIKRHNIICDIV